MSPAAWNGTRGPAAEAGAALRRLRFAFGVTALAAAGGALAQVTPAEPFGGRPFGADRSAPPPTAPAAQQPMVVQPGAAPVLVQPGGAPVVVQPPQGQVPVPAPQPTQVQAQPPSPQEPAQAQSTPDLAGQTGRQTSSVNPQPANGAQRNAPAPSQAAGAGTASMGANPQAAAPAPVTPPFPANRTPAMGTAPAASAPAQSAVRGLPPEAPKLVISGSVYSPDKGRRMLIVNGQVFREGADLGSGVMLEEVRPESAVLGFKGSRYNVYF